ncbi:MAG: cobyrinate a,c-diamide synthase [Syntrophales bacterium]|nr:cobyrinate a,c-diamide synthase [Syntrophales bacterium]
MSQPCPRLLLAALRGGAGKTTLTLGLLAAWRDQGRRLVPFKKGPDYIDPAWHALAAGCPSHNLDPFLMEGDQILALVARHAQAADGLLIEGNRGLYDGLDAHGTSSTAELAKALATPVVLVVDCTMRTRTTAALVLGCQHFDPLTPIRGVILNQIARPRHETLIRNAIEHYCGLPVLGALPRLKCAVFPERHMGLVPPQEHAKAIKAVSTARDLAQHYLDLEGLWQVACQAPPLPEAQISEPLPVPGEPVTIGIIRDSAFQFYYPENLEALEREGARLVEINAMDDPLLPAQLDAIYIGGGFPETHARQLSENLSFRNAIKAAARAGLPIYAECGGLMYLGEAITTQQGEKFPMVGVFPYEFIMDKRPQGHGYTILEVARDNPFFSSGTILKGHEFHYSRIQPEPGPQENLVFQVNRGTGLGGQREGLVFQNVLATYTHLHALGSPEWAAGIVRLARECRQASRLPAENSLQPGSEVPANRSLGRGVLLS